MNASRHDRGRGRPVPFGSPSGTRILGDACSSTAPRRTGTGTGPPRVRVGRVGALLALFTIFALVSAVVFHVVLAQDQLQLDRLNLRIAQEQRVYEQHRLTASLLASPQRVIQEAERLGLVVPAEPAQYLSVPGAPMPSLGDGATAETLGDWTKAKSSLGARQP